jgi:hypothetical protein
MYTLEDLAQDGLRSVAAAETMVSEDFDCPNCYARCNKDRSLRHLIGWCETTYYKPIFAVFECQECGQLYRHHISMFKFSESHTKWIPEFVRAARELLKEQE